MTTQTDTNPAVVITLTLKGRLAQLLSKLSTSKTERRDFANTISNIGELISLMFFFMFMSAILAMFTAYLLAYPNGPAGLVADLAASAGQTPEEYIPALGAGLVIMSSVAIFILVLLARFVKIDGQHDDENMYDNDDVMCALLELTEKVEELDRKVEA